MCFSREFLPCFEMSEKVQDFLFLGNPEKFGKSAIFLVWCFVPESPIDDSIFYY